eukprot:14345224-Alexandrium_andersonii.AAC.2
MSNFIALPTSPAEGSSLPFALGTANIRRPPGASEAAGTPPSPRPLPGRNARCKTANAAWSSWASGSASA